jgi:hypothetical protein
MALDVRRRLTTRLGIKVTLSQLLGRESVTELGGRLREQLVAHGVLAPDPLIDPQGEWEELRI